MYFRRNIYLGWKHFKEAIINGEIFDENGEIFTKESIELYLKTYSNGFVKGYHDLDNEIRETTSVFEVTNEEIANKIFSIIHLEPQPFSRRKHLYDSGRNSSKVTLTQENLEIGGKELGRYYKAWFFIMNNPDLFIEKFKTFYVKYYEIIEASLGHKTELRDIINEKETEKPKDAKVNTEIHSFKGLFIDPYKPYIPQFIDILRGDTYSNPNGKILNPLINSSDKWTGNKQAAHLFYKLLLEKDIVTNVTLREIGNLFSKRFEGLGKSFPTTKNIGPHALDYEANFTKEIGNVINKVT